ncbi:hypothetical protein BT67DRAFT_289692 [Trichocladium antarcticum]|uniref:Uncharacterized protein n=1 Tax=Trichocladium antarcticum TaxID=1450529 RepID=A0AAN6ULM5_9PEZI|nr:hypothetical protein BT67DRAFT_289692 [Trichocladium antarcticum]
MLGRRFLVTRVIHSSSIHPPWRLCTKQPTYSTTSPFIETAPLQIGSTRCIESARSLGTILTTRIAIPDACYFRLQRRHLEFRLLTVLLHRLVSLDKSIFGRYFFHTERPHSLLCPRFAAATQDTRSESFRRQVALGDSSNTLSFSNCTTQPADRRFHSLGARLNPGNSTADPHLKGFFCHINPSGALKARNERAAFTALLAFPSTTFHSAGSDFPSLPPSIINTGIRHRRPIPTVVSPTFYNSLDPSAESVHGQNPLAPSPANRQSILLRLFRDRIASV